MKNNLTKVNDFAKHQPPSDYISVCETTKPWYTGVATFVQIGAALQKDESSRNFKDSLCKPAAESRQKFSLLSGPEMIR